MQLNRQRGMWIAATAAFLVIAGCGGGGGQSDFAFVVMGDNEVGYAAWQLTRDKNPSSANLPQLRQTIADVERAAPSARFEVDLGDIVMNEVQDQGQVLQTQLDAWLTLRRSLGGSAVRPLLVGPGNHGVVQYDPRLKAQYPNPPAYEVFTRWIAASGFASFAGNGPTGAAPNPDGLASDESKLTYSFTMNRIHFVVVDTDSNTSVANPQTGKPYYGWIPLNWIRRDLATAQADPAVSSIIVLGHRPIEGPSYADETWQATILDTPEHPLARQLGELLLGTPKVRAYIAGHVHSAHAFRLNHGQGPWQIITGNAGSQLDEAWTPKTYGYLVVQVSAIGKITVIPYQRPIPPAPQKFYEETPAAPEPARAGAPIIVYDPVTKH